MRPQTLLTLALLMLVIIAALVVQLVTAAGSGALSAALTRVSGFSVT